MTADLLTNWAKAKHFTHALGLCPVLGGVLEYKPITSHMVSHEFTEVYDKFVVCTQVSIYLYCSMLFGHVSLHLLTILYLY